jgi:hypothetical protein
MSIAFPKDDTVELAEDQRRLLLELFSPVWEWTRPTISRKDMSTNRETAQDERRDQLDPDQSAIVQVYCMSTEQFDRIKDAQIKPALGRMQSLRIFPLGQFWDVAEELTYAACWLPLVTWLPFALYYAGMRFALTEYVLALVAWLFVWPVIEYALHRWFFHAPVLWARRLPPYGQGVVNVVRFLSHTVHHAHPTDRKRIATPLIMSGLIAVGVLGPVFAFFPERYALGLGVGMILGYVQYDVTHYCLHTYSNQMPGWVPRRVATWWARLHKAHANHHYGNQGLTQSFGVAHAWVDPLFGTQPK